MAAVKGISKLSGQAKSNTYPQPEGVLGDCMLHYGKKLGEDTVFCKWLALFTSLSVAKRVGSYTYSQPEGLLSD